MYRLNDFKFSSIDDRDYILTSDGIEALPDSFRLKNIGRVKDQGSEGSCSAQVAALLKEYHEFKDVGIKRPFSVDYIYQQRMNKDSEGMSPRDTLKLLMKEGALPRRYWRRRFIRKGIPEDIYEIAKHFRISGYARTDTGESLKAAIMLHGVGYMALPVYNNGVTFWRKYNNSDILLGGHAISVIGWSEEGFVLRNSWGETWGDRGETIMPFEDWNSVKEVWVAIDADTADIFKRSGKLKREFR